MNRFQNNGTNPALSIPHVCGDEPRIFSVALLATLVYHTCVGMNRVVGDAYTDLLRIPHVCGDEP